MPFININNEKGKVLLFSLYFLFDPVEKKLKIIYYSVKEKKKDN